MDLPFDGAISDFYRKEAPKAVRKAIEGADKRAILSETFPYREEMPKSDYKDRMEALQIELAKLQSHVKASGERMVVVFEGRDASGKGGAIRTLTENLNPRVARVVALQKPSDRQATQWYFQRYVEQLPAAGEIVIFDRSWYNRAVVEPVFGFCTREQNQLFYRQLPEFEAMFASEGIRLVKIWLNVGQAEQLRRFLDRERDPLKQWKLSDIDIKGLRLWNEYSEAIREMFARTHNAKAPWTVIRSDDKLRTRIAVAQTVLDQIAYPARDDRAVGAPDPLICGGPAIWDPMGGHA